MNSKVKICVIGTILLAAVWIVFTQFLTSVTKTLAVTITWACVLGMAGIALFLVIPETVPVLAVIVPLAAAAWLAGWILNGIWPANLEVPDLGYSSLPQQSYDPANPPGPTSAISSIL